MRVTTSCVSQPSTQVRNDLQRAPTYELDSCVTGVIVQVTKRKRQPSEVRRSRKIAFPISLSVVRCTRNVKSARLGAIVLVTPRCSRSETGTPRFDRLKPTFPAHPNLYITPMPDQSHREDHDRSGEVLVSASPVVGPRHLRGGKPTFGRVVPGRLWPAPAEPYSFLAVSTFAPPERKTPRRTETQTDGRYPVAVPGAAASAVAEMPVVALLGRRASPEAPVLAARAPPAGRGRRAQPVRPARRSSRRRRGDPRCLRVARRVRPRPGSARAHLRRTSRRSPTARIASSPRGTATEPRERDRARRTGRSHRRHSSRRNAGSPHAWAHDECGRRGGTSAGGTRGRGSTDAYPWRTHR